MMGDVRLAVTAVLDYAWHRQMALTEPVCVGLERVVATSGCALVERRGVQHTAQRFSPRLAAASRRTVADMWQRAASYRHVVGIGRWNVLARYHGALDSSLVELATFGMEPPLGRYGSRWT